MRKMLLTLIALATAPLLALTFGTPATAGATSAPATVFSPNPVAQLQNQALTDQKDADYAALQKAYVTRTLTHLDGSGLLKGDYADVSSGTGPLAQAPFAFHRTDDRFEQVMAYYWVTQAQVYLQSLGFTDVNNEPQQVRIDQYGVDNSFFNGDKKFDVLRFGKGGVDDAEDAEVILHEYGHAIQDSQRDGFGSSEEAGSIGEGFADYWALTVSDAFAPTPDEPCIADWDSVSYTSTVPHCLRRTDETKKYTEGLVGEVHADGTIWSSALYQLRLALGATRADTAIITAQYGFAIDETMPGAAAKTIAAAQKLYGNKAGADAKKAFASRALA